VDMLGRFLLSSSNLYDMLCHSVLLGVVYVIVVMYGCMF
jgi:hypothetical protein